MQTTGIGALRRARACRAGVVALLLLVSWAVGAAEADAQLRLSKHNCISSTGSSGNCASGPGLAGTFDVVVSPDGEHAYATAFDADAVTVFDRSEDGTLTQKAGQAGCISDDGTSGACVDGRGLDGASGIAISPSGTSVYVATDLTGGVAVFDRAANGTLTQKAGKAGCLTHDGTSGACTHVAAVGSARSVTVSPDGQNVYVAADDGVTTFDRAAGGALTQPASPCISEVTTSACTDGVGLTTAVDVAISPDGTSAYVAWLGGVSAFTRAADGQLTQKAGTDACFTEDGAANGDPGVCAIANAVQRARSVAVSPDGKSAYVTSSLADAVTVFDRAAGGTLTQKAGAAGCVEHDALAHGCTQGIGLDGAAGIAISPDGTRVYVASDTSDAVTTHDRAADGTLTPRPSACIWRIGALDSCNWTSSTAGARALAVGPDGKQLYVAGSTASAVLVLDIGERIASTLGEIVQRPGTASCVQLMGTPMAASCQLARPSWSTFAGLWMSTMSPDGRQLYAASQAGALLVFDRGPDGTLTQRAGPAGCVSETGSGGACADGRGLGAAIDVAVSDDGKNVYVVTVGSVSIAVFDRASDGAVTQKAGTAGCISEDGSGGDCVDGQALTVATDVTVSADGTSVIVVSDNGKAVTVFDRASDGSLTQKAGIAACLSDDGSGGACTDARALDSPAAAIVSRDSRSVYVASKVSDAVAVFDRAGDGTLTQKSGTAGCVSEDGSAGDCADGKGLDGATGLAESFDGKQVYVTSADGVAIFDRGTDGALTQKAGVAGCVSETGNAGECADGTNLQAATLVTLSADGRNAYVSTPGLAVFDRAADGTLTQKPGLGGCVSLRMSGDGACDLNDHLSGPGVTISPDGAHLYTGTPSVGRIALFDRFIPPPPTPGGGGTGTGGTGGGSGGGGTGGGTGSPTGPGAGGIVPVGEGVTPAGGPVPPPAADTTRPSLSRLSFGSASFEALTKGASLVTRGGVTLTYRLSEAATVTFTVERAVTGRRSGTRCVKQTRRNRRARSCTRYTKLRGSFRHGGRAGANTVRFSGRLGGRKLAMGRYRLVLVATDAAGNRSAAGTVTFRVRAKRRR